MMKAVCCLLAVMMLSSASAQDITQTWFVNSFSTIKQCSPIQVSVVPSADDTYKVDFVGDASVVKNLNAYVKDGALNIENTGIFKSNNPVGIRVSMPASALTTLYAQGPGSMTMLPGFSADVLTVQTQQYSGALTVGVNNTAAKVAITHASTAPLNISGLVESVQFSSSENSGPVVLNAVGSSANVNVQGGTNTVYIGGPSDLKITGISSSPALIQYTDGTCDLFQGTCTKVAAIPVQQVTEQAFTGASSGQICSCGGGCVTPTPPPSSVGTQCISTGPNNCKGCCERKLLQGEMSSDSSCFTFQCSPFVAPPSSPKPGSECASTGPACRDCCWNKVLSGQYSSDPSCQTLQCSPFLPTPPPPPPPPPSPPSPPSPTPRPPSPTGQSCITTSNCRSCCQNKLNKGTMYTDSVCYTNARCIPSLNPPPTPIPTPIIGNSCLTTSNCRQCCQAKEASGTASSDRGCSNPDLYPQCNTNLLGG